MERNIVFKAARFAAIIAFITTLVMGFGIRVPESGIELQPSLSFGPVSEFIYPSNTYPELALQVFTADSLFVLSYLMVFVGLYAATKERSYPFAIIGLGAGILTAIFDAVENAFFISYASLAINGVPLTEPALPLVYIIANLKWMGAFTALYAFGLVWPRDNRMGWFISGIMLLFPIVGVLGVAAPGLVPIRYLFFLVGMPLFAWYFWQQTRPR